MQQLKKRRRKQLEDAPGSVLVLIWSPDLDLAVYYSEFQPVPPKTPHLRPRPRLLLPLQLPAASSSGWWSRKSSWVERMPPDVGTFHPGRWTPWAAQTGTSPLGSVGRGLQWCTCPGGSPAGRSTSPASPSGGPTRSPGQLWPLGGWCKRWPPGRSRSPETPGRRWSHSLQSGRRQGWTQWSPGRPPALHLLPPHRTTVERSPDAAARPEKKKVKRAKIKTNKSSTVYKQKQMFMKTLKKKTKHKNM